VKRNETNFLGAAWTNFIDGNGHRTTFAWDRTADRRLRLKHVVDPGGGRITYLHDDQSRVKSIVDQAGTRTSFLYDSFGNPRALVNPMSHRVSFTYMSPS
jgi:YD repeat-containing protein